MMVKFISASEAARRIGVTDKTVRAWITAGKLDAHHVSKNRLAIAETDVERMAREHRLYTSERTPDVTHLTSRIDELEKKLEELSAQVRALQSQQQEPQKTVVSDQQAQDYYKALISTLKRQPTDQETPPSAATYTPPTEPPKRSYAPRERGLPEGAVLARHFALQHGVNPSTFRGHYEPGKGIRGERLIISSRPKPGRDEMEWFVTEQDAPRVFDFWRHHNVKFSMPEQQ